MPFSELLKIQNSQKKIHSSGKEAQSLPKTHLLWGWETSPSRHSIVLVAFTHWVPFYRPQSFFTAGGVPPAKIVWVGHLQFIPLKVVRVCDSSFTQIAPEEHRIKHIWHHSATNCFFGAPGVLVALRVEVTNQECRTFPLDTSPSDISVPPTESKLQYRGINKCRLKSTNTVRLSGRQGRSDQQLHSSRLK